MLKKLDFSLKIQLTNMDENIFETCFIKNKMLHFVMCLFFNKRLPFLMCWYLCVYEWPPTLSGKCTSLNQWSTCDLWDYLNCCSYGWRQMMSLPLRPRPLRKLPVVWRCPCHTAETLLSSFSFLSVSLCVYALYSFTSLCMIWVTSIRRGGHSRIPRGCFRSHSFTWRPQARRPHKPSQQPLPTKQTGPNIMLSRSRKRERTANLLTLCYN